FILFNQGRPNAHSIRYATHTDTEGQQCHTNFDQTASDTLHILTQRGNNRGTILFSWMLSPLRYIQPLAN
uniref:Uncharacterized protein n=1 Tax=Oncorhynchus tshawytscha TaxID=74940 RepID=A0AAZ3RFX3_ONCTS